MSTLILVLMVLSLICFVLAAAGVSSRVSLEPLGLAFWMLALVLQLAVRL